MVKIYIRIRFSISICYDRLSLLQIEFAMPVFLFFFNDTATTEIYTLSLHDALPIPPTAMSTSQSDVPEGNHRPGARARACWDSTSVADSVRLRPTLRGWRTCPPGRRPPRGRFQKGPHRWRANPEIARARYERGKFQETGQGL